MSGGGAPLQVEKLRQTVVKVAPARSWLHQSTPQAPSGVSDESAIAAARRTRIASVWALKSAAVIPARLLGCHANPKRPLPADRAA